MLAGGDSGRGKGRAHHRFVFLVAPSPLLLVLGMPRHMPRCENTRRWQLTRAGISNHNTCPASAFVCPADVRARRLSVRPFGPGFMITINAWIACIKKGRVEAKASASISGPLLREGPSRSPRGPTKTLAIRSTPPSRHCNQELG